MESAVVIQALQLAAKYGIPAVVEAISALGKTEITDKDLQELGSTMKEPEEYFK